MKKLFLLSVILSCTLLPSGCVGKETGDKILGIEKKPAENVITETKEETTEKFYTKEARYYKSLGDKHKKEGQIEAAIEYYNKSLKTDPTYYQSFKELGMIYEKEYKEYDKAKENYEKAIAINPEDPPLLYKLGNLYIHYDKYPEAITYFEKAIKILPDYAEAYRNLGLAYSLNNQPDKAIENYIAAIFLDPKDHKAFFNLGNAYTTKCPFKSGLFNFLSEGNCKEAITAYETAIKLNPDYIKAYANLANLYHKKGKNDKAREYYEKALIIDPENSIIKERLSSLDKKEPVEETKTEDKTEDKKTEKVDPEE